MSTVLTQEKLYSAPASLQASEKAHAPAMNERPQVRGKFLFIGEEKFYVRGVTYGTFRPGPSGDEYPSPDIVERDFALMAANNVNALRTYTVPPRWLLDAAARHGLRVMVGLPWEQHITFLDDERRAREIEERVREGVRSCTGHPAVLCYTVGNEIPAPIVRWHGARRVEAFIERLYRAAKAEDPGGLVTYVNFPSTEYLRLPFVDFLSFNVYLESQERLAAYLARLQSLAGDKPLVMAEIGLDSRRNGVEKQSHALDWQVRTAFSSGCAGAFLFAWTDEWYRGGFDIDDWDFGLTDRARRPKPALAAARRAFGEVPFAPRLDWPRISVVICSYNGARTIRDCFEALLRLDYPNFEVIVVDDGSTDETASIASEYPFRLISTENQGLSNARNTGMEAANGEIIAYIDDDAYPDLHWLKYLAHTYVTSEHACVGGPNIAPAGDGTIADAVANAPGGPVHVLISNTLAEHVPGCNLSVRKAALQAIGGFDPRYRAAGDDVDVCWRLLERGWTIGFSPAAMVWHHRRNSVRMYWKQQQGYGKAEALLEAKWPEKYNAMGHLVWAGRLYGKGLTQALGFRQSRIYQGTWGGALFQSVYEQSPGTLSSIPLMPEWYLIIAMLAAISALGLLWSPLLLALPLLALAAGALVGQAVRSAAQASFTSNPKTPWAELKLRALTAFLHMLQPLARLRGRIRFGLTPWRRRGGNSAVATLPRTIMLWSEKWQSQDEWLTSLCDRLKARGLVFVTGGDFDRWDVAVRGGLWGGAQVLMTVEEHGAGRQLLRFRVRPRFSIKACILSLLLLVGAACAAADGAWVAAVPLAFAGVFVIGRVMFECALGIEALLAGCKSLDLTTLKTLPLDLPEETVEVAPVGRAAAAAAGRSMTQA